jgi:hypothetical protein
MKKIIIFVLLYFQYTSNNFCSNLEKKLDKNIIIEDNIEIIKKEINISFIKIDIYRKIISFLNKTKENLKIQNINMKNFFHEHIFYYFEFMLQ